MFRPLLGHHQANLQNIKRKYCSTTDPSLFTINITRNRMQNPIIQIYLRAYSAYQGPNVKQSQERRKQTRKKRN
jgi:hypothetical protein